MLDPERGDNLYPSYGFFWEYYRISGARRKADPFCFHRENPRMLDPERDLAGATPESLARALLRPSRRAKAVVSDEVSVEKPVTDHAGDGVEHLVERS